MLNHFDTVFAFVAILTGLSLVVTSLTQMVGALFAFRGRHLRWGIGALLENYAPEIRGLGDALSRHLLHHPLVSDSMFSGSRWAPSRGLAGIVQFLWYGWKYATVVRSEELASVVVDLSAKVDALEAKASEALEGIRTAKSPSETLATLTRLVEGVAAIDGVSNHWRARAELYVGALKKSGASLNSDPAAQAEWIRELTGYFQAITAVARLAKRVEMRAAPRTDTTSGGAKPPTDGGAGAGAVAGPQAASVVRPVLGGAWEQWFDASMHRVSERFATNMRLWTVGFSLILALFGGVDALGLFNRLSSDPEYRALIVSGVDGVLKRAEALTVPAPGATTAEGDPWVKVQADMAELKSMIRTQSDLGLFEPGWPWAKGGRGFFGRVFAAMLLSLGAPFWFNALKRMANLRPALANKVESGT